MHQKISKFAETLGCVCRTNEPLSSHTTFKVGGPADMFILVQKKASLPPLLRFFCENSTPFYLIGNGSNLLFSDDGFRGAVLRLAGEFGEIQVNSLEITCGAGVMLPALSAFAAKNGLSGLEFTCGIPGTVGGGVTMNAGAFGGEMKDVVVSCAGVTKQGIPQVWPAKDLGFSYRFSNLLHSDNIVTEVSFKLSPGEPEQIFEKMRNFNKKRALAPRQPSAGSIFKRPKHGISAGELIDKCGLKGLAIGGASVSLQHAGYIVNTGGATSSDIANLILTIEQIVRDQTKITLDREIIFV